MATEIESHTGLIAEAGNKHYEFSHLTLQEYLCAEHLSRSPFPANAILRLLTLYPAPLAIATALSADPIGWLSGILLSEKIIDARADEAVDQKLIVFLDRLEFENPTFVGGPGLGLCMLSLCFTHSKATAPDAKNRIEKYLAKFMAMKTVRTSFVDVVTSTYRVSSDQTTHGYYYARIATPTSESSYDFEIPVEYSSAESGLISSEWIQKNFHQEILFEGIHLTRRR